MTAVTVTSFLTAPEGGWTADDLDAFPDDGLRYELVAPFDVRFSPRRQLQPDLVVLPKDRSLPDRRPFLVVEILSPSTRATDRTLKHHVFEQGGVPSFWLVDPLTPSVTVLELRDGAYAETAVVTGDESYDTERPYPVRLVPSELVR
ncbi:MAG: Uma2 family endonuclease [Actinobacteria bacterium]|nr:Uma2 family endonuclease [Actinomycetota bacterium]MBW3646379.1 Uma2 family endonuclease [Actinomycetota bacterium]